MARLYVEFDDVQKRFEGEMPTDRQAWVELRIEDAEAELIGFVPDLANVATVDEARKGRVRRLIADKILALYRNPDGALSISSTVGPVSESRTLPGARGQAIGAWPAFTEEELARVGYVDQVESAGSVKLRAYHCDDRASTLPTP